MGRAKRRRQSRNQKRKQYPENAEAAVSSSISADLKRAVSLHQAGKLEQASQIYREIIAVDPRNADAHHSFGFIMHELGDDKTAIDLINRAIELNPDDAKAYYNLGNALQDQDRLEESIQAYRQAIEIRPAYAEAFNNLGKALQQQDKLEESIQAYRQAIEIDTDYVEVYNNLGTLLRELGRLESAVQSYRKALSINPNNVVAHYMLAKIKKHLDYDDEIQTMENLLEAADTTDEQKIHLNFALGKAYEDLRMYEKAFGFLLDGNRIKRSTFDYDVSEDRAKIAKLMKTFDDRLFNRWAGCGFDDDTPIFILGMPRSGTTLVEQILSSHNKVYGAGELRDLGFTLFESNPIFKYPAYPDNMVELNGDDFAQFGAVYVGRLRQRFGYPRYISDKMPGNFLHIGMIKLILPQAKIIHCQRHPLDTCLSCFKNNFTSGQSFSYQLTELGQYYRLYQDLMSYWAEVLGDYILHFQYEDLVADQETQTRRLLDFCGLEWDSSCLSFHQTDRSVKTASVAQVRRPLYSGSVELWKNYENWLQPLISSLSATE